MKIINKKRYTEKERKKINEAILKRLEKNYCTNPICEMYENEIENPKEEICPECGDNTTYYQNKNL